MSNIIDFLERMGQDAKLRHANGADVDRAFANASISSELRAAIESKDQRKLEALIGANTNVCCIVAVPMDEDDGDRERAPERDNDSIQHAKLGTAS